MTSDQRGQATILVLGMTMVVFGIVGVVIDGTKGFIARRTLQSTADAAAMAGAAELDTARYYASKGRTIILDPRAADAAARRWLDLRGLRADGAVRVADRRIVVTLRASVPTLFLRVIGVDELPVAVEAASAPAPVP